MKEVSRQETPFFWVLVGFLFFTVLVLDRVTKASLSIPVLYIIPVVIGIYLLRDRKHFLWLSTMASVFTVIGFFLSYGEKTTVDVFDRGITIAAIWGSGLIAYKHIYFHEFQKGLELTFQTALDSAPHGILLTRLHGQVFFCNEAAIQMFGYIRSDLIGANIHDIIPTIKEERVIAAASLRQQNFEGYKPIEKHEGEAIKVDGVRIPVEVALRTMSTQSGEMILVSLVDLSELKKFENELKASHHVLEEKNDELENLVHTLSHDLKSPLVSISGFAELIGTTMDDEEADLSEARHFLQRIQGNVGQMRALIDSLLDLSRLAKRKFDTEDVELEGLIREVINGMELEVGRYRASIDIEPLPLVDGNADSLRQVFSNLISNSLKYSRPGVPPKLSVGSLTHRSPDYSLISVQDNGRGIDPAYHDSVFQLFQRLDNEDVEGAGVGLAITKKIIERHKGKIWIDPEYSAGTRFFIELPKRQGVI